MGNKILFFGKHIAILFLFFFLFLFVFQKKSNPGVGLDPSWVTALSEAHKYNYQFGKDIIFTYGPYGFSATNQYHPDTINLSLFAGLFLAIGFFTTFYLYFKSEHWLKTIVFLAILVFFIGLNLGFDSLAYIYLTINGYLLLNIHEPEKNYKLVLLLFPLGLLVLIKGTLIIGVTFVIFLSIVNSVLSKNFKTTFFLLIIPTVSMILFWIISNQDIKNIPSYFINTIPIISGYTEAMSYSLGSIFEPIFYLLGCFFLIYPLFREKKIEYLQILLFTGFLFLAFKTGFTRHDGHANTAANTLLFLSFIVPNKNI